MPRPAKSLWRHVLDGTFRPERHADLLLSEELPGQAPGRLRELQRRYREAGSERAQRALRVDFAEAAREHAAAAVVEDPGELLFLPVLIHEDGSTENTHPYQDEWDRWNAAHGLRWRLKHGRGNNTDKLELYRLVTGEEEQDLRVIGGRMPELLDAFADELEGEIPSPPELPPDLK